MKSFLSVVALLFAASVALADTSLEFEPIFDLESDEIFASEEAFVEFANPLMELMDESAASDSPGMLARAFKVKEPTDAERDKAAEEYGDNGDLYDLAQEMDKQNDPIGQNRRTTIVAEVVLPDGTIQIWLIFSGNGATTKKLQETIPPGVYYLESGLTKAEQEALEKRIREEMELEEKERANQTHAEMILEEILRQQEEEAEIRRVGICWGGNCKNEMCDQCRAYYEEHHDETVIDGSREAEEMLKEAERQRLEEEAQRKAEEGQQ